MSLNTGITTGTPTRIPFGAGVYFQGVTFDPKVAPTEEEVKAGIIGATQEGGTLKITPEFFNPELDGATVALMELDNKVGETAEMEVSFAEVTADLLSKQVIGEKTETTDKKYDVITSGKLGKGHYYNGFGFYGQHMDGRPMIILFKQALCTSGFSTDPKNKQNNVFKGTYACRGDIEFGTNKLPYAIFIRKAEGWTATEASEV